MSEPDSTYHVPTPEQEFLPDAGLDAHSVAAMAAEEAKEYLKLLVESSGPNCPVSCG